MNTEYKTSGPRRHLEYPELTMYQMIERIAGQYPKAPAYEFYNKKTSYAAFLQKINRAAGAFTALGVKPNDRITICMPNVPQALDAFYGISRIGAVANMIHPLSAEKEIAYYLNVSESKWILTLDMFYEKVKRALEQTDHPVKILTARIQDELPALLKLPYTLKAGKPFMKYPLKDDILWSEQLKKTAKDIPIALYDTKHTAVILYSGGTTGMPKGICLSDLNFNACALQAKESIQGPLEPGLSMLSCMPIFHGFGLGINIHTILIHGGECILMPSFNIKSYSDMMRKKKPNYLAGVPTIFEALLHAEAIKDLDMSFLQGMFCGGDSLPVELKRKVDAFLREHNATIQIREGYGLTECVTASCLTPRDTYRERSIGLPFPDTVYEIVKPDTDEVLPFGEIGEIVLKTPTLMLGYLNDPEATAKTLRVRSDGDVWLYTGDLGHMDEDGYVYFTQRMTRMIISNGYNIYPERLEGEIDTVPGVLLSCVIGVRDERRGQRVKAYVVCEDGVEGNDELKKKIMDHLEKTVAKYAWPKEIVFRTELPRTLVGKVAYHVLEEENEQKDEETV